MELLKETGYLKTNGTHSQRNESFFLLVYSGAFLISFSVVHHLTGFTHQTLVFTVYQQECFTSQYLKQWIVFRNLFSFLSVAIVAYQSGAVARRKSQCWKLFIVSFVKGQIPQAVWMFSLTILFPVFILFYNMPNQYFLENNIQILKKKTNDFLILA